MRNKKEGGIEIETYFVVRQKVQNISSQSSHRCTHVSHEALPQWAHGIALTLWTLQAWQVAIVEGCEIEIDGNGTEEDDRIIWFNVDSVLLLLLCICTYRRYVDWLGMREINFKKKAYGVVPWSS